jgi:hypothetical protein
MARPTTYPKFRYRKVVVFELWQIYVFHNPIFHVKKYLESDHVRITKVVAFLSINPTKLVWHFSEFSTIF